MHRRNRFESADRDTIRATFDGKVRIKIMRRGYGYYVVVRHPNGLEKLFTDTFLIFWLM